MLSYIEHSQHIRVIAETEQDKLHAPHQSVHDNQATMIINDEDLERIQIELESKSVDEDIEEEEEEEEVIPQSTGLALNSPSMDNVEDDRDKEYSHSMSHKTHDREHSIHSMTNRTHTDYTDKPKSPQPNLLDSTQLRHNGDDVEIGAISDDENSPVITPYGAHHESRMPRYDLF